jgi:hypothetical protein
MSKLLDEGNYSPSSMDFIPHYHGIAIIFFGSPAKIYRKKSIIPWIADVVMCPPPGYGFIPSWSTPIHQS